MCDSECFTLQHVVNKLGSGSKAALHAARLLQGRRSSNLSDGCTSESTKSHQASHTRLRFRHATESQHVSNAPHRRREDVFRRYLWSSPARSSWPHTCRSWCRSGTFHGLSSAPGTGREGFHSSTRSSPRNSGTGRADRSRDPNRLGPHSPLETNKQRLISQTQNTPRCAQVTCYRLHPAEVPGSMCMRATSGKDMAL